jgi:hypothetical protein
MAFICMALLLSPGCKKNEPGIPPPACFPLPACDAQTLLISALDPRYTGGTYTTPYKFHKTYGADGRINYIDALLGPSWSTNPFKGPVRYSGKRVCMLNTKNDTIMVAELNDCGQVMRAKLNNVYPWSPDPDFYTQRFVYEYDYKGRLHKLWTYFSPSYPPDICIYRYDQYDNVLHIQNEQDITRYTAYTYNYKRPIKGGVYDQGIIQATGAYLLEMLDSYTTQPHHLLEKMTTTYEYPIGSSTFFDQVVSTDGYLQSYKVFPFGDTTMGIKGTIIWKCAGGSSTTYQKY